MENTLLTANAIQPDYDRRALVPRIVHLGLARSTAPIRRSTPIYWPASTAATGATLKST